MATRGTGEVASGTCIGCRQGAMYTILFMVDVMEASNVHCFVNVRLSVPYLVS